MGCGIGPRQKGNTKKPKATTVSCKVSANGTWKQMQFDLIAARTLKRQTHNPWLCWSAWVKLNTWTTVQTSPTYLLPSLIGWVPHAQGRMQAETASQEMIETFLWGSLFTVPSNVYSAPPGRASLLGRPYHGENSSS